ncbi:uncharacterized protein LOC117119052 [Anneissia japonica]|uniref:uncharacterized protein LOC117119052 n=1 Tax=Anneissia japonica TaxID=1529436 RepID=UPI0014255BC9|nr:uncharacterized protein LOC117119052 [Anneissia japonica]
MIRHELSIHLVIVVFTFLTMVIFCSGQAFSNNGQSNEDLPREQYEHIRPYRSSSSGDFISYDLSTEKEEKYREYLKYMQQLSEFDIPASIPKDITSTIFYTFYAFGKQFLLNITLSQHLVAPNTSIEKHLDNGTVSTNLVQKNCFYQGTVNDSNDSIVSINNCNVGLLLFIRVSAGQKMY